MYEKEWQEKSIQHLFILPGNVEEVEKHQSENDGLDDPEDDDGSAGFHKPIIASSQSLEKMRPKCYYEGNYGNANTTESRASDHYR